MALWTPREWAAGIILLLPLLALAFAGGPVVRALNRLPNAVRLGLPGLAAIPYFIAAHATRYFQWWFVAAYAAVPIGLAVLLWRASLNDPEQRGDWRDLLVLAILGLVVEFRQFEPAWPLHLRSLNRLLLLDTGLYGFLVVRQLTNVGFNLRPRLRDVWIGFRELALYAPIAVPLGLGLGFLHFHPVMPGFERFLLSWFSIFAFVALLEETYFRGWMQNVLSRYLPGDWGLVVTAVLFGLSHFNKGAAFNWRYVLMATIAGIFYGRAWRQDHRLVASAITHASVDTIWLLWFR
jgi:uncharacterized protein